MSAIRLEMSNFPFWKLFLGLAASAVVLTAVAAPAQLPLLSRDGNAGKPNVIFTIDDSGSMDWQFMPDSMFGGANINAYRLGFDPAEINAWPFQRNRFIATQLNDIVSARYRSVGVNKVYYDPTIQYVPWANSDGSLWPNSNPTAALVEPTMPWRGSANLTGISNRWANRWCTTNNCSSRTLSYAPATYYDYDGGAEWNTNSFTRVRIADFPTFVRPTSRADCPVDPLDAANVICTRAQEYQNFANWFTYYRRRMSVAIGAFKPGVRRPR